MVFVSMHYFGILASFWPWADKPLEYYCVTISGLNEMALQVSE